MTRTRTLLTGAAVALLAPAAAADAATITTAPCAISGLPITVQGTGWAPGSQWSIKTTDESNQVFDFGTADAGGNFTSTAEKAPFLDSDRVKPVTFTLTGQQDQLDVASTELQVVNFLVKPKDPRGKPAGKTKWNFAGFQPGAPIYVHTRRKGKTYTERAGKGSEPCGTLSTRLRRLPAWPKSKIGYGTYKVAVDNKKKYAKTDGTYPQYTAEITVSRTFLR